jgi:DNA-binding XRE family transcriptional regulator
MNIQVINQDNKPEWAVIPYEDYQDLIEKAELLEDLQDYDAVMAAIGRGEEELIPGEVVDALLDGGNPVKIWREYRGLTQQEAAEKAGISVPYLSQIETAKRKGSLEVISALAKALDVSLDFLAP